MVDVDDHERHTGLVPFGIGELADETVVEVLAVHRAGETVDDAEFVAALERHLFRLVGEREAEEYGSDADAIAVGEARARDRPASYRRSVARAEILQVVLGLSALRDER